MAAALWEAVKANRVLQLGALGLFVIVAILVLMIRACSDDGGYRRVQAATQEMEEAKRAAGIDESEQQPGAKPPTRTANEAKGKAVAKAAPAAGGDEEQQPGARPATRPRTGPAGSRPGMPAAAPVALPEKFADWKEKDFLLAKTASDHRLLPAVQDYIQRAKGTESEVKLYVALLQSSKASADPASGDEDDENPRQRRTASSGLTATLVAALAANGTSAAREALRQLLAGLLTTADDRAATDTVLRSLAERPGQEYEELLYQVLTAPDKLRPPGQGVLSADALHAKACELVRRNASDRLRVHIADAAVNAATSETFRKRLLAILEQPDPRNFEAQIVLYQGGALEGPARKVMEKRLSAISGEALVSLLRLPSKMPVADAEMPQRVSARLWGEPFASWLAQQPQRIDSLEEGASLLTLAATVPSERVRAKLLRTLTRDVDAGPSALAKTGMAANVIVEPGFLVALKSVERYLRQSSRGDVARAAAAVRSEEAKKQLVQRQEQREKTYREWNEFSEGVLRAWCRRLYAATTNGGPRPRSNGETSPSPIKLAFRTHADGDDAEMVGAYRFDLPGAAGSGLADRLDLLQVRYARIEGRTRISRLVEFYRRQLDCEAWSLDDGVWLDCLLVDPASGRRRSLDVLITSRVKSKSTASRPRDDEETPGRQKGKMAATAATRPAASSPARPKWKPGLLPDDEQELIVDILSVEVNLPEE